MRLLLILAVVALLARPVAAEENEAEMLFRKTEQKMQTAKTLQIRFDTTVSGAGVKEGNLKGTLTLGEGDKLRLEAGGKPAGVEFQLTVVSDGTTLFCNDSTDPNNDKALTAPKALGAKIRKSVPRLGMFLLLFNAIDRAGTWSPDTFKVSDFKLVGPEKVGERNTQLIEYTVTEAKDVHSPRKWRMKMWIDTQTDLPVKLALTMPSGELADVSATIDVFSKFAVDAKVDGKLFVVPK
jgi:outer membrane lipoprotein-sorting protein